MTENNRFVDDEIESVVDQSFTDTLTDKTYWIDNGLGDIVNLLNNLYDENEELRKENGELRNNVENWIQRTLKAHKYFNILEKVIDEVCNDDINNQIWKEYEERERLIE